MTKQKNDKKPVNERPLKNETNFAGNPLSDKIGNSLKRMYDDVVNQPVPDDFLKLLIEADKKQG